MLHLPKHGFYRDAWVDVSLSALEHNYRLIRNTVPAATRIMPVVKSDAYGHGAVQIAKLLSACGASMFGVASVDEAVQLRTAGIDQDILVLSPTPVWAAEQAITHGIQLSIHNLHELQHIIRITRSTDHLAKIHLCLNTGMNREGTQDASGILSELSGVSSVQMVGIFSHLACGAADEFSQVQLNKFRAAVHAIDPQHACVHHIGASSAINHADCHLDMLRIGLAMYGLCSDLPGSQQVMRLKARISHIQTLQAGDTVGYDRTWIAQRHSRVALLPLGYADGIKRSLSQQLWVRIGTQLCPVVGRISMDQICIDITDISPEPCIHDLVTLLDGQQLNVHNWADALGTISYEIVCDLRSRLPRTYTRSDP